MNEHRDRERGEAHEGLERLTRELPREIRPERDLWPGIAARIAAQRQERFTWLPRWRPLALRLAAALLLVAGSSLATLWLTGARDRVPTLVATDPVSGLASDRAAGYDYLQARYALTLTLEDGLSRLSPETREIVERNLQEIRKGLEEIRTALARDPGNASLQRLLLATYQEELNYMKTIHQLTESAPRRSQT